MTEALVPRLRIGAPYHGAEGDQIAYPEQTIAGLIVAQAGRTPDAVAVRQWNEVLTYRDLVEHAAALADQLRALSMGPEDRVGISAARRPPLVPAVLGVLLSGAAYLPLDPGHPRRRLRDIVADAGLRVVVGDEAAQALCAEAGLRHLTVPVDPPVVDLATVRPCPARPDGLAHVLYTSGSTGRPKGVLTTHRNVVAFAAGCAAETGAGAMTRALGVTSLGFDPVTVDLFVTLSVGGSVQLASDGDRADPTRLTRFIAQHRVNWGFTTPAVLSVLDPDELPEWRTVMCGGDVLPPALVHRWTGRGTPRRLINMYGPTETTVVVTAADLSGRHHAPVPIGRPLPNHRAYVVDEHLRQVRPGEQGELLIGGTGVARGYLGRPGLTAERFVPDPFSGVPGARLYRTGDVAQWLPDRQLAYLGRRDGQLKIRGERVELGEIESVLREDPSVVQAAVVAVPRAAGEPELVGFVTPKDAARPADLLARAGRRLTKAMLPTRVLRMSELPRNSSDKVDRPRLRELASRHRPSEPTEARSATSAGGGLAAIWQRVIGAAPQPGDDFLAAGGHSIAAMRLVAAIRAELGRDVAVEDVLAGRTFAGIAERVRAAATLTGPELTVGNPPTLAPPQRRLWFLDQLAPASAPYNIALAQRLHGHLDLSALRSALRAVAERHDVLRWRIRQAAGVPYAVCEPPADVEVAVVELLGPQREEELDSRLAAEAAGPFDLETGPAWRATVYRLGAVEQVLALTFHHAVFDGWSEAVFYADLADAYGSALAGRPPALPPLAASYADYAVWRAERDRHRGKVDLAWWVDHLCGAPTELDLPRDRPRPAVQTYRGAEARATFTPETTAVIRRLATALGTTPASVLLAGLDQVMRRLSGSSDHVLGVVVADRRLAAFDEMIGFFIDMVPVRLQTDDQAAFADHVRRCGEELLDVSAHPGAPLERVVEAMGVGRDTSQAPLVQVMFNMLNYQEPTLRLPGLTAEPVTVPKPGSPFDLTVYAVDGDGTFGVDAVYNPDLFDAGRIDAILADYVDLVGALAASPQAPVGTTATRLPRPPLRVFAPAATVPSGPVAGPRPGQAMVTHPSGTEELIARVWCEVLERESVGPDDNFFDIGGHSLAVAAVHARLVALLGRPLRVVDLFRYPNIRSLAAHLDGEGSAPELMRAAERAAARRGRTRRRTTGHPSATAE